MGPFCLREASRVPAVKTGAIQMPLERALRRGNVVHRFGGFIHAGEGRDLPFAPRDRMLQLAIRA